MLSRVAPKIRHRIYETGYLVRSGGQHGRNPAVQHIEAEGRQATHAVRPSRLGPMALVDPNATLAARVRGVRYLL